MGDGDGGNGGLKSQCFGKCFVNAQVIGRIIIACNFDMVNNLCVTPLFC